MGTYENEIGKYLGENSGETPSEPKEIKLVDKVNDGTIKIGEYVKYKLDVVTNTDKSYTDLISNLGTYSGNTDNTKNTTSTLIQEMDLNWRVLDVKDGQVRLISDGPTKSEIAFKGYNGYNNEVKLLDDACSTLYSNATLASKVKNLKIEDIQDKMIEKEYSKIDSNYGTTQLPTTKYYPSMLLKEKEQIVNEQIGTELDLSEQMSFVNQTIKSQADSMTVKYTCWAKKMMENDFLNSVYYKLFINNGSEYPIYWLSSRCIYFQTDYVGFYVRRVASGDVTAYDLYYSNGKEVARAFAFRPVVTLNADVQIDIANSGNGSTAEQGYVIK